MSWQSVFPDVSLDLSGAYGAWDAELFNDVAMLFDGHADGTANDAESGGATDSGSTGRNSTSTDDLMDEDDLAILNLLLHSAQQSEAAAAARGSTPAAAVSSTEATPLPTSTVPTALVVVPSSTVAPVARKTDKIGAVELLDEAIPFTGKTTRERRKEEVTFLRVRAQELEAKLAKLKEQLQRQAATAATDGEQCSDLATRSHAVAPLSRYAALWMKLAKRQDEERRLALTENAKLRQLVVAQVRLARSLDRVLRKRMVRRDALSLCYLVACT